MYEQYPHYLIHLQKLFYLYEIHFLDIFGYFLYYFNKTIFKGETYPSNLKIFIWDKIFTPLTTIADFLTGYKFGKNILCIYKKTS